MSTPTTIKVSRQLRDRIAARAAQEGTTLAGAISHALDVSDEETFWVRVTEQHRREAHPDDGTGTPRDGLEPADDALGRDGW